MQKKIKQHWIGILYGAMILLLITAIILISCGFHRHRTVLTDSQPKETSVLQASYDRAWSARTYAQNALMERGVSESNITAANYGFTAENTAEYLVGFSYTAGNAVSVYGYRVTVDDLQNCVITEESEALGRQLMTYHVEGEA